MYLENIQCPADIKKLNVEQLNILCAEIREALIGVISKNGGHLASNLGVVELTVAVHYVFDSPNDSVLFDVGHQSYVHKLITGRFDRFETIRKKDGLSGFMFPPESEHDPFVSGHSSNSVSAACGIACANTLAGNDNYVVTVIGDGALTGGMAFEGFNNSGRRRDKMIVVVNDNEMSISKNVGALARHLSGIRIKKGYIRTKAGIKKGIEKIPLLGKPLNHLLIKFKQVIKSAVYNSNYFESLGYRYLGPVDGNNISEMIKALEATKVIGGPVVLHAITVKGIGFLPAEENPTSYHGVSNFDINTGLVAPKNSYSTTFGDTLCEIAATDDKICAVTAAMTEGTGLLPFKNKYPDRFFDVGIAEQHAVTFSAGLASKGFKPVFAVYSSFLQRSYDQLVHDVAVCNYNVTLAVDRSGIVGDDGITHQGLFDVALLNTIPGFGVCSPAYFDELKYELNLAVNTVGPMCIRYARGFEGYRPEWYDSSAVKNDYYIHHVDDNTVVVTYGKLFSNVCQAAEKADCSICKINRIKPLSEKMALELIKFKRIVFYEEGMRRGGIGETLCDMMTELGYSGSFTIKAIDEFVPHSTVEQAYVNYGFDVESITDFIKNGDKIERKEKT